MESFFGIIRGYKKKEKRKGWRLTKERWKGRKKRRGRIRIRDDKVSNKIDEKKKKSSGTLRISEDYSRKVWKDE